MAGVKYDFQPHRGECVQPTRRSGKGSHGAAWLSGLPYGGCDGGDVREGRLGAPHDKVSAPPWTALGDCGRALISLCQGLSASVMFTPQVCWLLADCSAKAPSYQPAES